MQIGQINSVTFTGYNSVLKTNWKAGKFPTVKKGFYGDELTMNNVSLEHLKPHSKGGYTSLNNLVLASKDKNSSRGNQDIRDYVDTKTIKEYLAQFIDIRMKAFNGNEYIKGILKTLRKLGVDI